MEYWYADMVPGPIPLTAQVSTDQNQYLVALLVQKEKPLGFVAQRLTSWCLPDASLAVSARTHEHLVLAPVLECSRVCCAALVV